MPKNTVTDLIMSGSEASKIVMIQDSLNHNGRAFLKGYIEKLAKRIDAVHIFSLDLAISSYRQYFSCKRYKNKIILHDCYSDVAGWDSTRQQDDCIRWQSTNGIYEQIVNALKNNTVNSNVSSIAVVIDSLSPLLSHNSINHVCSSLRKLIMPNDNINQDDLKVSQIIALLHTDLHDDYELSSMKYIASTTINLYDMSSEEKLKVDDLENALHCGLCETKHLKKSGKLLNKKEIYGIYSDFLIQIFEYRQTAAESPSLDKSNSSDPTENLTFNLKLTQSEKQARSRLKLPYTYSDERKAAELSQPVASSGGKIFYQPDDVDDFDEEDPDDDLDI